MYIDPHILSTPAIADIDADGHDELVVAVSYFYDSEYYEESAHAHELQGIDREKYVAGASGSDRSRVYVISGWLRSALHLLAEPCTIILSCIMHDRLQ